MQTVPLFFLSIQYFHIYKNYELIDINCYCYIIC